MKSIALAAFLAALPTIVQAQTIVVVPSNQSTYELNIATSEAVSVFIAGDVVLTGSVQTGGRFAVLGEGSVELSNQLTITGFQGEEPEGFSLASSSFTKIVVNTPLISDTPYVPSHNARFETVPGGQVEINKDVIMHRNAVTFINANVTIFDDVIVSAEEGGFQVNGAGFFQAYNRSTLMANHRAYGMQINAQRIHLGNVSGVSPIILQSAGDVELFGIVFNDDPSVASLGQSIFVSSGGNIGAHQLLDASGSITFITGGLVSIYGATLEANTPISIRATNTRLFGGLLTAPSVCIEGGLENFGATINGTCD